MAAKKPGMNPFAKGGKAPAKPAAKGKAVKKCPDCGKPMGTGKGTCKC
jgi:hypothetical protein